MASTGKSWQKEPTTEPTMTEQQLLELVLHSARGVSVAFINQAVRSAERAQSVGPLIHPSAWTSQADREHQLNLDILRRFEELRRALAEADEYQEEIAASRKAPQ